MKVKYWLMYLVSVCYVCQLEAQENLAKPLPEPLPELAVVENFATAEMRFEDDKAFSESSVAWIINDNEYVKSRIGIDSIGTCVRLLKKEDFPLVIRNINSCGDSLVVHEQPSSSSPLYINGVRYDGLIRATVSDNPRLLSIPEICRKYTDAPMSKIAVSVNGVTLLKDVASYKIAERYILRVDVVSSKDIENCDSDFTMVKIYTRTSINQKRLIMRLGQQ